MITASFDQGLLGLSLTGNAPNLPCLMDIDNEGLSTRNSVPPRCFPCFGKLLVYNTIERFRDADKQAITDAEAAKVRIFQLLCYAGRDSGGYRNSQLEGLECM